MSAGHVHASDAPPADGNGGGPEIVEFQSDADDLPTPSTPPDVDAIMSRDDFQEEAGQQDGDACVRVFVSPGSDDQERAEVHLVTRAFLVLPERRAHCELPPEVASRLHSL
jgi:hypothetical protein